MTQFRIPDERQLWDCGS